MSRPSTRLRRRIGSGPNAEQVRAHWQQIATFVNTNGRSAPKEIALGTGIPYTQVLDLTIGAVRHGLIACTPPLGAPGNPRRVFHPKATLT